MPYKNDHGAAAAAAAAAITLAASAAANEVRAAAAVAAAEVRAAAAILEAKAEAHGRLDDERFSRILAEIANYRENIERINTRIEMLANDQASMRTSLEGLPALIAGKIESTINTSKIWVYGLIFAGASTLFTIAAGYVLRKVLG